MLLAKVCATGLHCWLSGKESNCQSRRHGFDPESKKVPHAREQLSRAHHNHCARAEEPHC